MRLRRSSRTALVGFMIVLGAVSCRSDGSADIMPADIMPAEIGPQENGVIVFSGLIEDDFQLFSIHKDGSDLRQLTDDATMKTALAGSPDGSRIAYAAYGNELTREEPAPEFTSIYTIRVDGTDRTTLCEACSRTAYGSGPSEHENDLLVDPSSVSVPDSLAWSPDSSLIAAPAVFSGVLLMDAETGRSSTIPTPEPVTALAWSPDGKRLALSHTWFAMPGSALGTLVPRDGTEWPDPREHRPGGIYLLDVETGELEEVLSTGGMAHVHGWSPDGELFAYTFRVSENRHSELAAYSITEDRSWPLVEAEFGQAGLGTVWSPAGDRIAALTVQYDEQSAKDLWLVSSDGTTRSELPVCRFEGADGGDQCAQPTIAWSPDGTTVVYQAMLRGRPVGAALILQDVEGPTNVVRLGGPSNDIGVGSCCLVWLPAS